MCKIINRKLDTIWRNEITVCYQKDGNLTTMFVLLTGKELYMYVHSGMDTVQISQ
jgi:hypothetical protein